MEAGMSNDNLTRYLDAAIHSEHDDDVIKAVDVLEVLVKSDVENKPKLYYQLGVAKVRLRNPDGARQALLQCLELDSSFSEAKSLLELISAGDGSSGSKFGKGNSSILIAAASCVSLAVGIGSVFASSCSKISEIGDGLKKAGKVAEDIEKRIARDNVTDTAIAAGLLGIVLGGLYLGIKKTM